MTLRNYEIFALVAKTGNFTKAAKQLYVTQSAISYAIKELEERAGTRLFERMHTCVKLTTSGELLLQEVLPILAAANTLEMRLQHLQEDATIHIVSCITIAQSWLPKLLKTFQERHPKTPVQVEIVRASNAMQLVREGACDIAFVEGQMDMDTYDVKPLFSYPLSFVCAYHSKLASSMKLEELITQPLLLREKGSAVRDSFDGLLAMRGYHVIPTWTSVDAGALIEAAAHDFGVAVLPNMIVEEAMKQQRIKEIRIRDMKLANEAVAIVRKQTYMHDSLQALWEMLS